MILPWSYQRFEQGLLPELKVASDCARRGAEGGGDWGKEGGMVLRGWARGGCWGNRSSEESLPFAGVA